MPLRHPFSCCVGQQMFAIKQYSWLANGVRRASPVSWQQLSFFFFLSQLLFKSLNPENRFFAKLVAFPVDSDSEGSGHPQACWREGFKEL